MTISALAKGLGVGALWGSTRMFRKTFFESIPDSNGFWSKYESNRYNNDTNTYHEYQEIEDALLWGPIGGILNAIGFNLSDAGKETMLKGAAIGAGIGALYGATKLLEPILSEMLVEGTFPDFEEYKRTYSYEELDQALNWGVIGGATGATAALLFLAAQKTAEWGSQLLANGSITGSLAKAILPKIIRWLI